MELSVFPRNTTTVSGKIPAGFKVKRTRTLLPYLEKNESGFISVEIVVSKKALVESGPLIFEDNLKSYEKIDCSLKKGFDCQTTVFKGLTIE